MPSHLAKRLWIFTRGKRSYQSANMKSDVRVGSKSIVGRCPLITALQPRAKVLPRCCYVAKVPRPVQTSVLVSNGLTDAAAACLRLRRARAFHPPVPRGRAADGHGCADEACGQRASR